MELVLMDILACLQRIEARLGQSSDSRSSVALEVTSRGTNYATKAYAGSPIRDAEDEAVASFERLRERFGAQV